MTVKKLLVWVALFGLVLTCNAAVTVGAIRWDVWVGDELNGEYGTPNFKDGIWNEKAIYPEQWRCRLPFFASNVSRTNVQIRCTTQTVMDQEIKSAAGALDYWAFLDYPVTPMHKPLELYLNSSQKNRINFCIILNGNGWWLNKQRYVDYFKDAGYHKVLGGRPLVYILDAEGALPKFADGWAGEKSQLDQLAAMSVDQGAGDPYFVTMGWVPATVQTAKQNLGADAVTAYAYATEGAAAGKPYSKLVSDVKARWNNFAAGGYKVGCPLLWLDGIGDHAPIMPPPIRTTPIVHGPTSRRMCGMKNPIRKSWQIL